MKKSDRVQRLTHKGQVIVVLDLSGMQDEQEIIEALQMRSNIKEPHGLLVDLTNTHFSRKTVSHAKEGAKGLKGVLKVIAVIGSKGMMSMVLTAVSKFSGINIATFGSKQEALDWLAAQMAKP